MRNQRVARGYARALIAAADETNVTQEVRETVEQLLDLHAKSEPFREFVENPMIPPTTKRELFTRTLGGSVPPLVATFLQLLAERRRERYIDSICEEALRTLDERDGIETALVTTAIPLDNDQSTALANALSQATGKTIRIRADVDASILGGFVARVQDTVYDASVTTQLARLRESLIRG